MPLIHTRWRGGRAIAAALGLAGLYVLYISTTTTVPLGTPVPVTSVHEPEVTDREKPALTAPSVAHPDVDEWNSSHYLTGNVTSSFRSSYYNLRDSEAH